MKLKTVKLTTENPTPLLTSPDKSGTLHNRMYGKFFFNLAAKQNNKNRKRTLAFSHFLERAASNFLSARLFISSECCELYLKNCSLSGDILLWLTEQKKGKKTSKMYN